MRTDEHGYKSVNYAQLTPVLIEALKVDNAALHQQAASTAGFEQRLRTLEADGARAEARRWR